MFKYHHSLLCKVVLLNSGYLVLFTLFIHAANRERENTLKEFDQFRQQSISTSIENQETLPGSSRSIAQNRMSCSRYLSLNVSRSKISLIKRKENELKKNYDDSPPYPKQSGHHWNLLELSDVEALNVCNSLWFGLTFSEIDEIDQTDLPSQLYAKCKQFKSIPIGDIRYSGKSNFCYNVVYPYTKENFQTLPHRISSLKCKCAFTRNPKGRYISNDSERCFFAHKLKDNEYLILSPVSKNIRHYLDLKIIDVQKVDPNRIHVGDTWTIPISTEQTLGNTDDEFDHSTSSSDENLAKAPASRSVGRRPRLKRTAAFPIYLTLTVPQDKIDTIIQKENELKNNYDYLDEFSKTPGHIWNVSHLSESEADNVCYSIWIGLTFNEIDEINKTNLPPHLYSYCKHRKYPVGGSKFSYKIVYPRTEKYLNTKHPIGVLECVCRFTRTPTSRIINHESNRKFFTHKLQHNEYLVLSPVSKEHHFHSNLEIIEVQEVNHVAVHFGDKRSIPISTN